MITCEEYEERLSAHLDGELDSTLAVAALAHALECPSCGEFYRAGKRLAMAVAAHLAPPAEAPEESWERVRGAVGWRRTAPRRAAWLWRAAAVLAVGVGGWWLAAGGGVGQRPDVAAPEAVSASSDTAPSQMTDRRFAELAGEVLAAEPRYRQALLGALETVGRRSEEGAGEESSVRSEAFRPLVGTTGRL